MLLAGGGALAAASGRARGQGEDADVAIAALLATAELLAIDFYGRAIELGGFGADDLVYLESARENEEDHVARLAEVLGAAAPRGVSARYAPGTFAARAAVAAAGAALEEALLGAYLGAVGSLRSTELKGIAALIGANEAQHLAALERLAAGALVASPSLPRPLSAEDALAALGPYTA